MSDRKKYTIELSDEDVGTIRAWAVIMNPVSTASRLGVSFSALNPEPFDPEPGDWIAWGGGTHRYRYAGFMGGAAYGVDTRGELFPLVGRGEPLLDAGNDADWHQDTQRRKSSTDD